MQETQVWSLIWEDPTWRGATKPVHHSYSAFVLEPGSHNNWSLHALEPVLPIGDATAMKTMHTAAREQPRLTVTREKPGQQQWPA